ncbi:MAG: hypothetical protein OEY61_02500 [Gammaproteobacteria bacterium]|nr:hypothetical protein [Gammaproteobacteria bacterium]
MLTEKQQLLNRIAEKEAQLFHVTKAASNWNASRYKTSGYVQTSRVYVRTLQKDIKDLKSKLAVIENKKNHSG